jgi:hypothetical protein
MTRAALVKTDISEERITSIISVQRVGELRKTLAVTSNRSATKIRQVAGKAKNKL